MSDGCLDEQALLDFLAGAFDRGARTAALAHLDGCGTCREVLASLARARREAAKGRQPGAPTERVPDFLQPTSVAPALQVIGNYRLERKLGEGGMAEVFLATQLGPGGFERRCVVKVPRAELSDDPDFRKMFLSEAKVLAALEHPNVARVLELGEAGDRLYLAMEYVEGRNLQELVASFRAERAHVPVPAALEVTRQAALGLGAAHGAVDARGEALGLIHRDVSPQNVMLARAGGVKLIDFGLARSSYGDRTAPGVVKGKPRYFSPEQALGGPLDARADVFSLGLVLFELLTSERAYDAENVSAVLHLAQRGEVPRKNPDPKRLSKEVWRLYLRCTEREPGRRFGSMAQLVEAIEALGLATPAAVAALAARSPKAVSEGEATQPMPRRR